MNRKTLLKRAALALAGIAAGALGMECAKRAEAATDAKPDDAFAMGAMGTRHVWDTPEEDAAWSHLQEPETQTSNSRITAPFAFPLHGGPLLIHAEYKSPEWFKEHWG